MDDLISRQELLKRTIYNPLHVLYISSQDVLDCPSAQKKGHWNFVGDNLFECTCCGKIYTTQQLNGLRVYDKDPYCPFFCPNCGADMRGEEDG